ncbi:MAG TPA: hypothetical protein PLZ43_14440, partial [bacterium]|nr:hypothetical protein [bacterium]
LVGERHDPALEAGAITIERVIKALTDDLEADSKAVLDGGASINQFPVDSYLFRYWYAIALKLFLEGDKNLTGLKFSDLQTVISNISMDKSELFPADEKAKKVTDQPPVISEKQFKRSYETEYQNYSVSNIIYANDSVFNIKFKALPDETGDLTIDLVELFGDVEVQSLSDINEEGLYTAEVKFPVAEDGEKSIGIRAVDNAENTGNATLQAVKDTVKPLITNLGNTLPTNVTTPLTVPYAVTETNPLDSLYTVTPAGEAATVWTSLNPAILAGDITVTDSLLDEDGAYTLHFKSVDRAGNETVQTKTLSFDRIIPTATFTTLPEINENGFIAQNSIAITIIATDNLTSETELLHEMFDGVSWVENIEAVKNVWNMQLLSEQLYAKKFRVKDLAGNKSADINVSFTVDTVFPVLTTNKTALESTAYNIASTNLKLISTCTESNLLAYSYSINGGDLVSITEQSTPLTDNASLVEGLNTITVRCTDKAENYTEETISLLIDNTPPRVDSVLSSPGASVCALSQAVQLKTVDDVSKPVSVKYYYSFGSYLVSDIYSMPVLETGETTVSVPNGADTYYSTLSFTKETQPGSIFVSVVDQAGNESEPYPVNWNLDREPPKFSIINLEDFGFGVINPRAENIDFDEYLAKYNEGETVFNAYVAGLIAESGLSDITSLKGYINNVLLHNYTNLNIAPEDLTPGKCSPTICSNSDIMKPCLWCVMTRQTSTFTLKATFTDSCGNSGSTTDCMDSDYTCITRSLNPQTPELSVYVNQISTETHSLEILSQGATILTCKIYRNSDNTFIKNCSTVTGTQQIDTTALTSGIYRAIVTSKYPDGTATATASDTFLVDRTAFSISVNIDATKLYYVDFPLLKYDVKIASGLKQLKLYMTGHYKNKYYVTAGESANYNCTHENRCFSTVVRRLVNTTTTAKGNMLPTKTGGYYNIDGGWYTQIYYEAIPNFGDIKTGTIIIGTIWGSGLGFIKNSSQDTRMTMTEAGDVTIIPSIVDSKIFAGDVITVGGKCKDFVCAEKVGGNYFYHQLGKCKDSAFIDGVSDTFFTGKIQKAGDSYYNWWGGDCRVNSDCPVSAPECNSFHLRCVADITKHDAVESEGYSCDNYNEFNHLGCELYLSIYYYPDSAYVDLEHIEFRPKKFYLKNFVLTYNAETACSSIK